VGRQAYDAGTYAGRVELVRAVLEEVFGLPSTGTGNGGTTDVPDARTFRWALGQNKPNPVASMTRVSYEVATPSRVSIKIYDAQGRLVQTLVDQKVEPGKYLAQWDGTNLAGGRVSSGVYFYKMEAGRFNATKKMLVVR
jgi:flagellar hook assembly protein FlgD